MRGIEPRRALRVPFWALCSLVVIMLASGCGRTPVGTTCGVGVTDCVCDDAGFCWGCGDQLCDEEETCESCPAGLRRLLR